MGLGVLTWDMRQGAGYPLVRRCPLFLLPVLLSGSFGTTLSTFLFFLGLQVMFEVEGAGGGGIAFGGEVDGSGLGFGVYYIAWDIELGVVSFLFMFTEEVPLALVADGSMNHLFFPLP